MMLILTMKIDMVIFDRMNQRIDMQINGEKKKRKVNVNQ
jgi:hypothetical protein